MSLLAGMCTAMFARRFGRWRGALAALLTIGLYTLLVGAQAAVVRAAVMSGLAVFASLVGRRQAGLTSLAFTGTVMACIQPFVLWDVGFQLSVTATLGLVLFGDTWPRAFQRWLGRWLAPVVAKRMADMVGEYLLLTLAAQLMTLPVIVFHFRRFSLVSLLANPVVLPVQPLVMILGGLSLLGGLVWLPVGRLLAYAAWPLAAFTIRAVEMFSKLPGAEWTLPPISLIWVAVFYVLVLGWALAQRTLKGIGLRVGPAAFLAGIALVTIQVWRSGLAAPDGLLHLTVLDVNHNGTSGEALLIESPEGRFVLVNGGPSFTRLSDGLGRRINAAGGGLDWVVVGGVQDEELRVLPEIIERYSPQGLVWARKSDPGWYARQLEAAVIEQEVTVQEPIPGLSLDLGAGAVLDVLAVNQDGLVLSVSLGQFQALLPLGMEASSSDVIAQMGGVNALLLAESGDARANPPEWIGMLQPQVVLLSVAAGDRYGLPDPAVMQDLEGYTVLRTDHNGWIELTTDGKQLWVEVEKR
jgi:competence protein ComEC